MSTSTGYYTGGDDLANHPDVPKEHEETNTLTNSQWRIEFDVDWHASHQMRDACNEDIRFIMAEGGQWEGFMSDHYVTTRPRLEMDKVHEKINVFMSQFAKAKPSVKFGPADGSTTSPQDCKLLNGMFRADQRRDNGYYAIWNAVHEGIVGGMGGWRLRPSWDDPEDDENYNQHIVFEAIHAGYASIIWDSNSKRYDKRDARHCNIITFLTTSAFKARFPGAALSSVPVGFDRRQFNWNTPDGVFISERYWIEDEMKEYVLLRHPDTDERMTVDTNEMKAQIEELDSLGFEEVSRRKRNVRTVRKAIYSGTDILEEPTVVPGKFIPIIPFYAFWIYADSQEHYFGLTRKRKDPQRLFNTQASALAELSVTSMKEVPIFAPEQMRGRGVKDAWSQAHLGKTNYLTAEPLRDFDGSIIQAGPIGYTKPPQVDPALAAVIELCSNYLKETGDAIPDEVPKREVSGDALREIREAVDLKTYLIMENVYNSLLLCGDVYREMAADVYVSTKQVNLLDEDGTQSQAVLNDLTFDPQSGEAQIENEITGKRFECYADIGPSFASMREEAKKTLLALLERIPQESAYYPVLLAEFINLLDGSTESLTQFNREQMLRLGLRAPETPQEEQMLQSIREKAQQPTPEDELVKAAARKELSEAAENEADARVKESQVPLNRAKTAEALASAEEKNAGAFETAAEILQFPKTASGSAPR